MSDLERRTSTKFKATVEIAAWILVGIACLLFCIKTSIELWAHRTRQPHTASSAGIGISQPAPQIKGVAYHESPLTFVVAVSTTCRFCLESSDFYRRLAKTYSDGRTGRVVFLFPQNDSTVNAYLSKNGLADVIAIGTNVLADQDFGALRLTATPTVLLVNSRGIIEEVLVGKLSPAREREVLDRS
jgi:hypothetical protein